MNLHIEIPTTARAFWAGFVAAAGGGAAARFYESFHFGDSEALANEPAALVVAGTKCATASLVWSYEADCKALPKPGHISIVERWSGEAVCVIETVSVEVLPFGEVGAEFAATEGEGDGSLEYWRTGHWAYFARECARIGKAPSLAGRSPLGVLKSVASGLLGAEAFKGGIPTAALGLVLHRGISVVAARIYLFAARRAVFMREHYLLCGSIFGVPLSTW